MATIQVPRLQMSAHTIMSTDVLVFEENKHRTRFVIQHNDAQPTYFWIGDNPDSEITNWFHLSDMTTTEFDFTTGIFGPIYVAEDGGGDGQIVIISNLIEVPTITTKIDLGVS